ncbi:hypothetical protein WR25_02836 [Diploscapter pachys]|uniref:G-protein coupled receptors family 1 profile domain-containing protein n=1 Tax=Diploscapter pachys TaxID=2018661 RepID=A0A2A2K254_9BILA|nr:hypothetical protein WR25_02836 [Diploscapter pachys]
MQANSSCEDELILIEKLNDFFRDEDVHPDSEHSNTMLGYLIFCAYMVVIFFGSIGNFLTMTVVVINPSMRTTRNFFILNLALSDFFVCSVTAPMTLYTILYTFWSFGRALCKITGSLQGFSVFLSTFSITAIALDRSTIPLFIASGMDTIPLDSNCGNFINLCHEQDHIWNKMPISKKTYTLSVLAVQYAFPLCSLVFVYSRIAHRMKMRFVNRHNSLNNHSDDSNARRKSVFDRQRRTHLLLMCVVAVFAVAWLPLNIFHILTTFDWIKFSVPTFAFCHVTAMCSASLNPVIYAFFNQNFRTEFIRLIDRVGLRKIRLFFFENPEDYKTTKTDLSPRTLRLSLPTKSNARQFPSMSVCSQTVILPRPQHDETTILSDNPNCQIFLQPGDQLL